MVLAAVVVADTTVAEVATLAAVAASVEAAVLAVAVPQEAEAAAEVGNVLGNLPRYGGLPRYYLYGRR